MAQTKTAPSPTPAKRKSTLAGSVVPPPDGNRAAAIANYEAAIALMQAGKFDKAHAAFNKMLLNSPGDLADRIRMYTSACLGQAKKSSNNFANLEEQCDYAVYLLNGGNFDDAREQFADIVSVNPAADYAFYGLAVLASLTGDPTGCLDHLTRAIHFNHKNRIQARADSDFQDMADDPRFTELLYPEA